MAHPKVSVIIPVYNTRDFLELTLQSICMQTLREIEIIVINDGSTDLSLEIIERIAATDNRIVVYTQQNQGLSATRNRGIELAHAKYVYFMDSDDILELQTLELCYQKCEQENLDMVIFDAESFCDDGDFTIDIDYRRSHLLCESVHTGMEALDILLRHKALRTSACLSIARLDLLNRHNLRFIRGILHEDELFTPLLYIYAQRVGAIALPLFRRRLRGDSITTSQFSMRHMNGYMRVMHELHLLSKTGDKAIAKMAVRLLQRTLNGALYKAASLPKRERIGVALQCIRHYPTLIKPKTFVRMMLRS